MVGARGGEDETIAININSMRTEAIGTGVNFDDIDVGDGGDIESVSEVRFFNLGDGDNGTDEGEILIDDPTEQTSEAQLAVIDQAIADVGSQRAELGAIQNRFQSTIANLSNVSENVSGARSRIMDTDFAAETAELTKFQITQQASTSILAQANQRPQAALSLL